jgi:cytochrome c55X
MARRLAAIAAAALLFAVPAIAQQSEREAELVHRLKHDCGSCHGLTMKGGLGPPLLPTSLQERSEEVLAEIILAGVPGTPMPPWQGELSRDEARWLVGILKQGLKP